MSALVKELNTILGENSCIQILDLITIKTRYKYPSGDIIYLYLVEDKSKKIYFLSEGKEAVKLIRSIFLTHTTEYNQTKLIAAVSGQYGLSFSEGEFLVLFDKVKNVSTVLDDFVRRINLCFLFFNGLQR